MRKPLTITATVALAAAAVAACSPSTTVNTQPDTNQPTTTSSASPVAAKTAHVGNTISIQTSGGSLAVTLVKVAATVKATDGFSTPPKGDRFYGVQLRIRNNTSAASQGDPGNDVTVQDASGESFQTDIVERINAGPLFPSIVNLAPGASALGWLVLDVPAWATVTQVQFTAQSGFGNTAQWSVP